MIEQFERIQLKVKFSITFVLFVSVVFQIISRNLLPGKIIHIHPSVRGSPRDNRVHSPCTDRTGSDTTRIVRFTLIGTSIEDKSPITNSSRDNSKDGLDSVRDSRASTAFEIHSETDTNERFHRDGDHSKDDVSMRLTREIGRLFQAVRPISCRTGYENQLRYEALEVSSHERKIIYYNDKQKNTRSRI